MIDWLLQGQIIIRNILYAQSRSHNQLYSICNSRNVLRFCLISLKYSSQTQTASCRPSEKEARNKVTISSSKYPLNKKILHYRALQMLKPKEPNEFIKPLLEIIPNDLMSNFKTVKINHSGSSSAHFLRHRISWRLYRTTTIEKYIADLPKIVLNINQLARLEIVSAGNNFLKGDYSKAAAQYLSSSRMESFVKNDQIKANLIEKLIAFVFISQSVKSHTR